VIYRDGDWLAAKVGDEMVMMSATKGNYIGLSPVGARIWELLETPRSLDEICEILQRQFDVAPDVCRTEVEHFIADLEQHEAIAVDDAATGRL